MGSGIFECHTAHCLTEATNGASRDFVDSKRKEIPPTAGGVDPPLPVSMRVSLSVSSCVVLVTLLEAHAHAYLLEQERVTANLSSIPAIL